MRGKMKQKGRQIISILMLISMVFGSVPITVYADEDVIETEPIVHYDMTYEGTELINIAGDETLNGSLVSVKEERFTEYNGVSTLTLDGTGYISLPSGIVADNTMTVEITAATTKNNNQWLWTFGKNSWEYTFFTPANTAKDTKFTTAYQASHTSTGAWADERNITTASTALDGQYFTYTVVFNENITELYINGVKIGTNANSRYVSELIPTSGIIGYIGKSFYSADPLFDGRIADFKVYDTALTSAQIQQNTDQVPFADYIIADIGKALLNGNESFDEITTDVAFPAAIDGIKITWTLPSDTDIISDKGKVTAPLYHAEPVSVTAAFNRGGEEYSETYYLYVKAVDVVSDEYMLEAAKNELEIPNAGDIRGNISLPAQTSNGAVVTWESDTADVITMEASATQDANYNDAGETIPAGVVTRQEEDTNIKLTATIAYGALITTKIFNLTVKALPKEIEESDYTDYFFSYFSGESYSDGEQVYFAASQDGLNWADLNANEPVLYSEFGEKGVRDPFLIRSPEGDKFYIIATDLKINGGKDWTAAQTAGSQSLIVWESTDLVNWTDQRMIEVSAEISAGCTWAPEAMYDEVTGEYVVFWASKVASDNYAKQRIYYAKTRDFYTFTEPKLYIEKSHSIIDTTMIYENDKFYRYSKNESTKYILADTVPTLLHSNATSLTLPVLTSQPGVEGPAIFKLNEDDADTYKYCILLDNYGSGGYYPLVSTDLNEDFIKISSGYKMPSRARHGTPIKITSEEYHRVMSKYGSTGAVELVEEPKALPILKYDFDDLTIKDMAGSNHGTLYGNAKIAADPETGSNVLKLDGTTNTYGAFPVGFFDGRNTFTLVMDVKSEMASGNFFTFTLGKSSNRYYYLKTYGDTIRSVISKSSYGSEEGFNSVQTGKVQGKWVKLAVVMTGDTMNLYMDGQLIGTKTGLTVKVTDFGYDVRAYLGKSFYSADSYFKGSFDNIKVYNKALTVDEIYSPLDEDKVAAAYANLEIPNKDNIRGNVTLPESDKGAAITWKSSDESVISTVKTENEGYDDMPAGVVNRQAEDKEIKLTATISSGVISENKIFTVNVRKAPDKISEEMDFSNYLFAHFTGTEGSASAEQIYFASSRDGYYWKDLNNLNPVLTSAVGEKGVRDPYILRSYEGDCFYMLATDLSIFYRGGWSNSKATVTGSHSLVIWESEDLVNWSEPRLTDVALPAAGCTWAPEAIYDQKTGEYVVFWAATTSADNYGKLRIYYAKTRDFYTFTEPQVFIERANHEILDTTMIKVGDTYYRASGDGQITIEKADSVLGQWEIISTLESIGLALNGSQVEGPEFFKYNGEEKWGLLVDQYSTGQGYLPLETTNIGDTTGNAWRKPSASEYSFASLKKRHGSILPITSEEYSAVMRAYSADAPLNQEQEQEDPILEYNFEGDSGTTIKDSRGTNNGTSFGSAAVRADADKSSKVLYLNGTTNSYAQFPTGFFDGRNTFTISMDIKSEMDNQNFFTLAIGKDTNRYMFLRTRNTQIRNAITLSSYSNEQDVKLTTAVKNNWLNVTIVVTPTTMKLFVDGVLVDENNSIRTTVSEFGSNVLAYLGKSFYSADSYFKGSFDNIKVYNRALSEYEVAEKQGAEIKIVKSVTITSKDFNVVTSKVNHEDRKVTLYLSKNNSTSNSLSNLPVQFKLADGIGVVGGNPITLDLNTEQEVQLNTAKGMEIWTVNAVWSNNPVLGGQFADPDIDILDGKFYIFPTTDGFTSWSGTQFHAFSSEDLINWADEGVIVDVANNNPGVNDFGTQIADVPWAVGSAWAPTIEEKNGKYYFYFCAKRSNGNSCIGVAVSDHPAGPYTAQAQPLITPESCTSAGVTMGQTIDPSIYTEDGRSYVLFGNGNAAIAELNDDMISLKPGTMKNLTGATDLREAITVNKRNGIYHFTWSCDDTGSDNYHINYGTATNLYGPIVFKYTVLSKDADSDILGTGHHALLKIPDVDEYYIAYHRFVTPLGQYSSGLGYHRETCIDKVTFNEETGLLNVITPTLEGITSPVSPAPKAKLRELLERGRNIDEKEYTIESYRVFIEAYVIAQGIMDDEYVNSLMIDKAFIQLLDAYEALEKREDLGDTDLADLIRKAQEELAKTGVYTAGSLERLQMAVDGALVVVKSGNPVLIEAAAKELQEAIEALDLLHPIKNPDIDALRELIKKARLLADTEGVHTQYSRNKLSDLLDYIEALVVDDLDSVSIDSFTEAINEQIDDLVLEISVIDRSVLLQLIDAAEELLSTDYTVRSWEEMEIVLEISKSIYTSMIEDQILINDTVVELQKLINNLVDLRQLKSAIEREAGTVAGNYTLTSWYTAQIALYDAKAVLANPSAAREEVDTAADALNAAFNKLVVKVNKNNLKIAIDKVSSFDTTSYTTISVLKMKLALNDAQKVYNGAGYTQGEVDAVTLALNNAVEALVLQVNKAKLKELITSTSAIPSSNYTFVSWYHLRLAISAATTVANNGNATQAQVDEQVVLLEAAQAALVAK